MNAPEAPGDRRVITPLAALTVVVAAAAAMSWPAAPIRPVPATVIQEHDAYPHPLRLAMRARAIHQRPSGRSAALGARVRLRESPRRRAPG